MPSPGVAPTPARTRRAAGAAFSLVLLGGALAGCGGDDEPSAEPTRSTTSASPSPSESASESATASPSASPTSEPTDTGGEPGTLESALLTAAELPGLNDESPWTEGATGPVGTEAFGWCSQFDALTIGASEGVQRQFTAGEAGDVAGQQVLDLVDDTNARRAEQTFRGWHRDCQGAEVGPVQAVPVPSGDAWWYLSSRPDGDGQWEAFGLVRDGSRITVLRMQHDGQDHSYESGQDPLELALQTASTKLG